MRVQGTLGATIGPPAGGGPGIGFQSGQREMSGHHHQMLTNLAAKPSNSLWGYPLLSRDHSLAVTC
jgi:hypothetical protein